MFKKRSIALLAVVLIAVATAVFFLVYYGVFKNTEFNFEIGKNVAGSKLRAHFYKDSSLDITKIKLKVFYVIPKDKKQNLDPRWQETLKSSLAQVALFHKLELRGFSSLAYDIFPQPVFLGEKEEFYNSTSTDGGNPRGLISIAEDIDRRVFKQGGDLYDAEFAKFSSDEYPVMGLIYEGVGASGGVIYDAKNGETRPEIAKRLGVQESMIYIVNVDSVKGFFLLNLDYLRKKDLAVFGPTFLYHELAHSFGLPDREDSSEEVDIMGVGRQDPIEASFIGRDLLRGLGVIPE